MELENQVVLIHCSENGELPSFPSYCNVLKVTQTQELSFVLWAAMPSVVLVDFSDPQKTYEFLDYFVRNSPQTIKVVVASDPKGFSFDRLINDYSVFRIALNRDQVQEVLKEALAKAQAVTSKAKLRKESTKQLRELEHLTTDLENLVLERTKHIEISRLQEEERLNRIRNVIRFIKQLSTAISLEDVLNSIRKEIKKFPKLGDPFLLIQSESRGVALAHFENGQVGIQMFQKRLPLPDDISVNAKELSWQLANLLGRPLVRVTAIPIEIKMFSSLLGEEVYGILGIESSLSEEEQEDFIDFLMERLQPISMTVDRFLLEDELTGISYRWEKTFDGMRDPIAIIDESYNVLRANKKFIDRISIGKCYEIFGKGVEPCLGCPIEKVMKTGKTGQSSVRIADRIYEVHSYPIDLLNNSGATLVHQYVDVTQSRDLYLRYLQNEKMTAVGLLAGNIAHELNNPLTGLRSLAQILAEQEKDRMALKSDLQEIEKAAERSQAIIKNLLDFSKGVTEKREAISLSHLIGKTMPLLKTVIRLHRFDLDLAEQSDVVFVESHLMQQVIFNLINNACQAMKDKGELKVSVTVAGSQVILQVRDSGPGIPEAIAKKIFEPFFTTKQTDGGTGLGLSLTKKIVESFSGAIRFFPNDEGRGVTFEVRLPLASEGQG